MNIYNVKEDAVIFHAEQSPDLTPVPVWKKARPHSQLSDCLNSGQQKPRDWHWPQTAIESHGEKHADVSALFITCTPAFIDINTDFQLQAVKFYSCPASYIGSGKAIMHRGYKRTQALHATFSFISLSKNSCSNSPRWIQKLKGFLVALLCACTMYFQNGEGDRGAWGRRWGRWGGVLIGR